MWFVEIYMTADGVGELCEQLFPSDVLDKFDGLKF